MKRLIPISRAEATAMMQTRKLKKEIEELKKAQPKVVEVKGKDGKDGKDGVTTTVVKEVLANKEALLDKEEFEEFKKYMVDTERDIRNALAGTHNYFGGGGGSTALQDAIVNVINVSTTSTITSEQLLATKINVIIVETAGITITLPIPTADKLVIIQQGYDGTSTHTVIREAG